MFALLRSLLQLLIVPFLLSIACLCCYRLYFHPLAKYPGPFWAKLTDGYSVYHALKGDRHIDFYKLHQRYGDFVRYGPSRLSINNVEGLKDIYAYANANLRKGSYYEAVVDSHTGAYNSFSERDRGVHAFKRKLLAQSLNDRAVALYEQLVQVQIRRFEDIALRGHEATKGNAAIENEKSLGWGAPFDISEWFDYLSFDIMGNLVFSKTFDMLGSTKERYLQRLLKVTTARTLTVGVCDALRILHADVILLPIFIQFRKFITFCDEQANERVERHRRGDKRQDIFKHLVEARESETGRGLTMPELWSESILLVISGSETTSTAMSATLHYLSEHPATLERAVAEVRNVFPTVEDVSAGKELSGCVYLRACVDEAMRLSPPTPGLLPRQILPGGATIAAHSLPAGIEVGCSSYSIHRLPSVYPAPMEYRPERWLPELSAPQGSLQHPDLVAAARTAFSAFSHGPRSCVGKGLAYMEIMVILARLLVGWDIRRAHGSEEMLEKGRWDLGRRIVGGVEFCPIEYPTTDRFISGKYGPVLQLRPRLEGQSVQSQ
jgi:cytochrome P450